MSAISERLFFHQLVLRKERLEMFYKEYISYIKYLDYRIAHSLKQNVHILACPSCQMLN